MLAKKMLKNLESLEKDLNLYINIHNKKIKLNDYKLVSGLIKQEVDILNIFKEQFAHIKDKLKVIFKNLNEYNKPSNSVVHEKKIKRKRRFKRKNEDREPNENLINNKNILSGGAWESNRRKH